MFRSRSFALIVIAAIINLAAWQAEAQLTQTGAGKKPSGAPPAYVGPGDVKSGAKTFYGLRAYSAAIASGGITAAIRVQRASDSQACDILLASTGDLGNVTSCTGSATGAASAFCNATTCTVQDWYDQINGWTAQPGSGPTLVFNCNGTKPCTVWGGAGRLENFLGTATAQPLTITAVAIRTGVFTSQQAILTDTEGVGFAASTNTVYGHYGADQTATAADNAWHALQFVINDASSVINVDGTGTAAASIGTNGQSNDYYLGSFAGTIPLTGDISEIGIWPSAFSSGEQTSMCHNIFVWWGTSTSC